jgi:AraC family transcriptional regulator, regulatory protein of adaptative response / methylated-DNA-[protein]-cysteine methyltransferase
MKIRIGRRKKTAAPKPGRKKQTQLRLPIEELAVASVKTSAGRVYVVCSANGLREVHLGSSEMASRKEARARGVRYVRRPKWSAEAVRAIERFVAGRDIPAALPLDLAFGTPFQRRVWDATRRVPWGQVESYSAIAARAGAPRAVRAVGNALGRNPVPIVVPCHRVIHFAGSIGGFTSGLDWKRYLLSLERGQLELTWRKRRILGLFR